MRSRYVILLAAACVAAPTELLAEDANQTVVSVKPGVLRGKVEGGVIAWKGVPFAAPPVGELRWRRPQPVAQWDSVRDAGEYGPDCMQVPFPSDAAPLGTEPSEDCLYLNIWKSEQARPGEKLPVLFWIYGGGFVNGGASPPTYSGAELAKKGIMVVSANYRIGRLGAFAHPALTAADADDGLFGNYGYMDQIAALEWVRDNIANFGGDPANVTIVGESAGGMSVHTLITSPMAEGLFSAAVIMSGGSGEARGAPSLEAAEQVGIQFALTKGILASDPEAANKLRALSAVNVIDGLNLATMFSQQGMPHTYTGPFSDGKVAVDPTVAYSSGKFAQVPVMVGATSADIGGPKGTMIAGARHVSEILTKQNIPVYAYRFSYVAESVSSEGAQHATEIPYFFGTTKVKYRGDTSERDIRMGEVVSDYLVNFIRNGNPNGAALPNWPTYDRTQDIIMNFSADGRAITIKDPLGPLIDSVSLAE